MQNLPIHKDLRKLCRQAEKDGFVVQRNGSGHFRIEHPSGPFLIISSTPNDNAVRDARRKYAKAQREVKAHALEHM